MLTICGKDFKAFKHYFIFFPAPESFILLMHQCNSYFTWHGVIFVPQSCYGWFFLSNGPHRVLAFVWWPYMGHAGNPTFLLSASGISSLHFCIISTPGTVTLDVMAQSQTLRIVSPKLVTNEALLEKMSNVSRLFLITLCLSLSPPLVCPQTAVAVCSFAWPFLEKKLAWLHCRVRAPCTPICGGTELSLCANDPCQAQGSRACCGARKGNSADANEVHVHSVSVCAESCTCDNIHPLEYKMSDFRETWMVTNENEKRDDLFSFLWPLSAG